jgi:hypothetical protein
MSPLSKKFKSRPDNDVGSDEIQCTAIDRLSRGVLPFHFHRLCTHVSFTAVLSMNVFQHCLSGERSLVSNASFKVLDAHCMSAGTTHEGRTSIVSTDAVDSTYSVRELWKSPRFRI